LKPAISIIIPTYNGQNKVANALKSLEKQSFQNFEVIVVIDGSKDNTEAILKKQTFNFHLKVIVQENKGRSGSRNRGVKEAEADLLLFLDDDIRIEPNGIEKHLEFYQKILKSSILMGCAIEDFAVMTTDFQKYKGYLSRKWGMEVENRKPLAKDKFFLTAANCSMKKDLFYQLGEFDEKLKDAEDYDLGKRATENDIDIYFDDSIIGWHDDFITCKSYITRQQQYKVSHQKLKEFYPNRYQKIQYDYKEAKGIKKMIYWFFSGAFWVNVIDKFNFLRILPKKLRYKIYDIIVTANTVHFPLKID
jgi:glycosyltransferase involved in cell wall biosynthesis